MLSVADRISELRRTKKRPAQSVANWIARERRRGNHWLADSIAEQAGVETKSEQRKKALDEHIKAIPNLYAQQHYWPADSIAAPKPEPAVALAKPKYWWQDD